MRDVPTLAYAESPFYAVNQSSPAFQVPVPSDESCECGETAGQMLMSSWLARLGQLENLRNDVMEGLRDGMAGGRSTREIDDELMRMLCDMFSRIVKPD